MAKKNGAVTFKCSSCGYSHPGWLGHCPRCGEWNTFEEYTESLSANGRNSSLAEKARPVPLENVPVENRNRLLTGISEFDRVLGGGAAKRSAILIGGEPGIGKSTLLIQTASSIACSISSNSSEKNTSIKSYAHQKNHCVLYVSIIVYIFYSTSICIS